RGLRHAHEAGMVHRDVKPANLILTREGPEPVVKILDFGLAKGATVRGGDAELTGRGVMLGTPGYMAPEQVRDAAVADARSDIYSLGCTLFFLLTGRPPYPGDDAYAVLAAQVADRVPRVTALRSDVTGGLADVVARMMAKDPAARYASAADVA